jgi:hypothetical protein
MFAWSMGSSRRRAKIIALTGCAHPQKPGYGYVRDNTLISQLDELMRQLAAVKIHEYEQPSLRTRPGAFLLYRPDPSPDRVSLRNPSLHYLSPSAVARAPRIHQRLRPLWSMQIASGYYRNGPFAVNGQIATETVRNNEKSSPRISHEED